MISKNEFSKRPAEFLTLRSLSTTFASAEDRTMTLFSHMGNLDDRKNEKVRFSCDFPEIQTTFSTLLLAAFCPKWYQWTLFYL